MMRKMMMMMNRVTIRVREHPRSTRLREGVLMTMIQKTMSLSMKKPAQNSRVTMMKTKTWRKKKGRKRRKT